MPIRRNAAAKPSKRDTQIASIARRHLGFETLERRYSDELDFRDVLVSSAEDALNAAYDLGQASGITAGLRAAARDAKPKANPRRRNPANSDVLRTIGEFYRGGLISHAQYTRFDAAAKAVKTTAGAAELKALVVRTAQHR